MTSKPKIGFVQGNDPSFLNAIGVEASAVVGKVVSVKRPPQTRRRSKRA